MNIFVTSCEPSAAVRDLDDTRLNKMILETAQLLSAGAVRLGYISKEDIVGMGLANVPKSHWNHPCSLWAGEKPINYDWLQSYLRWLLCEYTHRRNNTRHHAYSLRKYDGIYRDIMKNPPNRPFYDHEQTIQFVNCSEFKDMGNENAITAYRMTLLAKWKSDIIKVKWTNFAPNNGEQCSLSKEDGIAHYEDYWQMDGLQHALIVQKAQELVEKHQARIAKKARKK